MARPRVFVSSTYYDLKHIRERIERFISIYNFEPVLFESNNVYFNPQKTLDASCYKEVESCQMMILIIGGRYGSLETADAKDKYEKEYVSITQKEYITSIEKGIPAFVFIDKNVYAEYETYIKNKDVINAEDLKEKFKFAHVDDKRIFDFIESIKSQATPQAIKPYEKVDDIESYFISQVSGMLYTYLESLQTTQKNNEIKNAVAEINQASTSMRLMIDEIAKKVLQDDYEKVLEQQNEQLIDFFIDIFLQNVNFGCWLFDDNTDNNIEIKLKRIISVFNTTILNVEKIPKRNGKQTIEEYRNSITNLEESCIDGVKAISEEFNLKINIDGFKKNLLKIKPLLAQQSLKDYFDQQLYIKVYNSIVF